MHYLKLFYLLKKGYFVFLIFSIGCLVRIIPEFVAYPFPIGYDVINYYIPVILNFENDFNFEKFQIYSTLLYIISTTFSLSAKNTVIILSSICYGLLSLILYIWSQKLRLSKCHGFFMTIFIIFQVSLLRTGWDLHKDILALVVMFTVFYIITYKNRYSLIQLISISSLLSVIFFIDIMISFLTFISLIIYFAIHKNWIYLSSIIGLIIIIFTIIVIFYPQHNNPVFDNIIKILEEKFMIDNRYNQINMMLLFVTINILNIPTFIIGLRYLRASILYISTTIVLIGSFSWLILPNTNLLLPDRWIILSGIFISIFSYFGLIRLIHKSKKIRNNIIFTVIFSFFVVAGLLYMVMPYNQPFPIYAIFREYTDFFIPATMQFNSIDIEDNNDLLISIEWINNYTESDSKIYGHTYLKGWMKIMLKENRTFDSYNNNTIMKEGIHLVENNKISNINRSADVLFTRGNFHIIENLHPRDIVNNLTKMK